MVTLSTVDLAKESLQRARPAAREYRRDPFSSFMITETIALGRRADTTSSPPRCRDDQPADMVSAGTGVTDQRGRSALASLSPHHHESRTLAPH